MYVVYQARRARPGAVNARPAAACHHMGGVFPAAAQVFLVLLVDVSSGVGGGLPQAHHLFRGLCGHIQIQHPCGLRQPQQPVLEVKQPVEKTVPLLRRQLTGLVNGVAGGVSIRNDQSALLIVRALVLFVGGIAIHRVEH